MKRKKTKNAYKGLHDNIIQELEDIGIQTEILSITIEKGPKVVIDGEVYSHKDKDLICQAIVEIFGIEEIEDYTVIMEGIHEDLDENDEDFENIDELEDNSYGTEDIFESIEEGEPYIPPITHIYSELSQTIRWKKKRKNKAR